MQVETLRVEKSNSNLLRGNINYNQSSDLSFITQLICLVWHIREIRTKFIKIPLSETKSNVFVKLIMKILQTSEQLRKCRSFIRTHCPTISHHGKSKIEIIRTYTKFIKLVKSEINL